MTILSRMKRFAKRLFISRGNAEFRPAADVQGAGPSPVPASPRAQLAWKYLRGAGVELGALHNPSAVPPGCSVRYVDRLNVANLRRHYPELASLPLVTVDVVDDGEKLTTFANDSQDFVIANHFLEHTQDPIGTIKRHLEVVKPGGVLFMAVPDKRATFDHRRPVTTLEHLYRDYEEGPAWSYLDHVREYVHLVGCMEGATAEAEVKRLIDMQYSIHFHVWTQNELIEMLVDIRRRLGLPFDVLAVLFNEHEAIFTLKKTA
jgi:predicted SAM-dependent methyltransferase